MTYWEIVLVSHFVRECLWQIYIIKRADSNDGYMYFVETMRGLITI